VWRTHIGAGIAQQGGTLLSTKLVQLIEEHWEEIATRLTREVHRNSDMRNLAIRPDAELREWCQSIVSHLGQLLIIKKDEEIRRRFEVFGRNRFQEHIPLHEAVLRLHCLQDIIVGFVHEQGFPMTALQLYAEEELEQRMTRFFHACVYHVVRGYEAAKLLEQRVAS
jgi:hypothetical protein